jgi:ParB family chromosome partitioning protein
VKRRDTLRELMRPVGPMEPADQTPDAAQILTPPKRTEPVRPGPLRSIGLSLKQMSAEADDARALRAQIEGGQHVVDLDPSLVDPSFITDRIPIERDPSFDNFVQSIAEAGQQVPILVRPHPDTAGRYQAAYGHRRLRAAAALGRSVRAIVRPLTDAELVVAQGKENGDRRDLSFIERATFAAHLEQRGFDRPTIMAAIGVDKADLSRLIALAKTVPGEIVQAIGPAPKAGRPRWTQLAEAVAVRADAADVVRTIAATGAFGAADSDKRFGLVLTALRAPTLSDLRDVWQDKQGRALVRIERSSSGTRLTVDERLARGFGAFLIERLSALHEEFQRTVSEDDSHPQPSRRRAKTAGSGAITPAESSRRSAIQQGGADTNDT